MLRAPFWWFADVLGFANCPNFEINVEGCSRVEGVHFQGETLYFVSDPLDVFP
jgi:hypothetical protein